MSEENLPAKVVVMVPAHISHFVMFHSPGGAPVALLHFRSQRRIGHFVMILAARVSNSTEYTE